MREHLPRPRRLPSKRPYLEANRILTEEPYFEDSQHNLGLQLADIAATTLFLALNGNLRQEGWAPMAGQLIRKLIRKRTAPFLQLGQATTGHPPLEPHAAKIWRTLRDKELPMMFENAWQ